MSVTLSPLLPLYAFSRNPIPVKLTSTDVITTPGVAAVMHLDVTGPVTAGNTIRITWSGRDITMTCAAPPDGSGEQFPEVDPGVPAQMAALATAFKRNPYIRAAYLVSVTGSRLDLTAINAGVYNNMTAVTTGNLSLTVATPGVTQVSRPNFRHYTAVLIDGERVYASPLALDYPASAGITTKDVAKILHAYLGSDAPDMLANGWRPCPNTFKPYQVEYGQYYGDNPKIAALYETDIAYVNKGALDLEHFAGTSMLNFLQPALDPSKTLCLRQGSRIIDIQQDQPEWLYWINFTGAQMNILLRVVLTYSDGTTGTSFTPPFTADANKKYYMPVGFIALDILRKIANGKTLVSYTVNVQTSAGIVQSESYTYQIDKYREWARYFVYLNSLGGYQTLYTWGKGGDSISREKQDTDLQVTDQQAAIIGSNQEDSIYLQKKLTVFTGYRTDRDILLLQDFFASREKYLVLNGRLVPIGISSTELDLLKDGEGLNGRSFECYPQYRNWAYTDDPAQPNSSISTGNAIPAPYTGIRDRGPVDNKTYQDI